MVSPLFRLVSSLLLALALGPAALMAGPAAVSHAADSPSIHVMRASLPAGEADIVTGSGYPAGQVATITTYVYTRTGLDSSKLFYNVNLTRVRAFARIAANGTFKGALRLPIRIVPGSYGVSVDTANTQTEQGQITVVPLLTFPARSASPRPAVSPLRSFVARGSGFAAGQQVTLTADFPLTTGSTLHFNRTVKAAGNGRFEVWLKAPQNARHVTVGMTATQGNTKKTATLRIAPIANISVGSSQKTVTVVPGSALYVAGKGYQGGENVTVSVNVPMYNHPDITITRTWSADASGTIRPSQIRIPKNANQGTLTISSTGVTSKKTASFAAKLVYYPSVKLTSSTVGVGGSVTANGYGYLSFAPIKVTVSGPNNSTVSKDVTTDANGHFNTSISLPNGAPAGDYSVSAVGSVSGLNASAKFAAKAEAALSVNPGSLLPGQKTQVTGSGFSANSTINVSATFKLFGGRSRTVNATAHTDANGSFSLAFTVPGHAASGNATIMAKGPQMQATSTLSVKDLSMQISVSPATTSPGSMLTVHGTGYPANDTVILKLDVKLANGTTRTLSLRATTDGQGNFTKDVRVPGNAAVGSYLIKARSTLTGRVPTAHFSLSVNAAINVQPGSVQPGHKVAVTGQGFGANAAVKVTATFSLYGGGSKTVSRMARTNAQGHLATAIWVPKNAASSTVTVQAKGPNAAVAAHLSIARLATQVTVNPASVLPGSNASVNGSGYLANSKVAITASIVALDGSHQTVTASATTNTQGQFTTQLHIPGNAKDGTYTVSAHAAASNRTSTAKLTVAALSPSIVVAPTTAVPGTKVTVNGFGFVANESIDLSLQGTKIATVTTNEKGQFTTAVSIPSDLASGSYPIAASSQSGRHAQIALQVNRTVSTHLYFASIYTGNGRTQLLSFVNPTAIRARVTITYERKDGTTKDKTVSVAAHSQFIESANSDLGYGVSASAAVASDVPIVAERTQTWRSGMDIAPASSKPGTLWYFANGNTTNKYREYIAVQNPSNHPITVTFRVLPTHHHPITIHRTMPATSRTTLAVQHVVHDAVGVIVRSASPIAANRTDFVGYAFDTKQGVSAPHRTWYFAGGSQNPTMTYWLGAINPNNSASYVTVKTYSPTGRMVGMKKGWVPAHGRIGYQINHISHRTDAAITMTSSRPMVAEQMTYLRGHKALTDTFGVWSPSKSFGFAAVDTTGASRDTLNLFNPGAEPLPIVVQYLTTSGNVVQRTYVVNPKSHLQVSVGSVLPNAKLGIVATSSSPFVALNRQTMNNNGNASAGTGMAW